MPFKALNILDTILYLCAPANNCLVHASGHFISTFINYCRQFVVTTITPIITTYHQHCCQGQQWPPCQPIEHSKGEGTTCEQNHTFRLCGWILEYMTSEAFLACFKSSGFRSFLFILSWETIVTWQHNWFYLCNRNPQMFNKLRNKLVFVNSVWSCYAFCYVRSFTVFTRQSSKSLKKLVRNQN